MARTYGKVEVAFWTNPKIRKLDHQGQLALLYLFSCSHGNLAGCFVLPTEYVTADLRIDETKARLYLKHLADEGFIERDEATGVTRIIGWWGHNGIENENTAKAVVRTLLSLPDGVIRLHAFADLARHLGTDKFSEKVKAAIRNQLPAHKKARRQKKPAPGNGEFSFANASQEFANRSRPPKPKPKPINQESHPEPRARPESPPKRGVAAEPSLVNGSRLGRAAQPPNRVQEITPTVLAHYGDARGMEVLDRYGAGDEAIVAEVDKLMEAQA